MKSSSTFSFMLNDELLAKFLAYARNAPFDVLKKFASPFNTMPKFAPMLAYDTWVSSHDTPDTSFFLIRTGITSWLPIIGNQDGHEQHELSGLEIRFLLIDAPRLYGVFKLDHDGTLIQRLATDANE